MRKKRFVCVQCYKGFTRYWNLQRHAIDLHNSFIQNPVDLISTRTMPNSQFKVPVNNTLGQPQKEEGLDSFFKPISDAIEITNEYSKLIPTSNLLSAIENLQNRLRISEDENWFMKSNLWSVPITSLEAFTAFHCKRCLTVSFKAVMHIGFDKTAEAAHRCDELKVKQLWAASCSPLVDQNTNNFVSSELMQRLNLIYSRDKFFTATDISEMFSFLTSTDDYKTKYYRLSEIFQRYPAFVLSKDHNIIWIHRAIRDLDQKISASYDEIMDFLRRFNSTYAVVDAYKEDIIPRRILIKIVP